MGNNIGREEKKEMKERALKKAVGAPSFLSSCRTSGSHFIHSSCLVHPFPLYTPIPFFSELISFFCPEDGGSNFLCLPNYTVSHLRRLP
jgi:hypothetical protein